MTLTDKQRALLAVRLSRRGRPSQVSPETRAQIAMRYVDGERVADLAAEYGVLPETVYGWLRKARDGK